LKKKSCRGNTKRTSLSKIMGVPRDAAGDRVGGRISPQLVTLVKGL
jgi:hypothetical protein